MGEHRVMCGDATSVEDVARLMGRDQADLVFTDPPYGVAYQSKLSKEEAVARHRRIDGLEVSNDRLGVDGTQQLVADALRALSRHWREGGAFYVCSPSGDMELPFRLALIEAGLALRQQIVWVKDVFVMGRQDYHWRHETLLYGWREGAPHYFAGGRSQDTVWEIPRPKRSEQHPTMKPVELVERAVLNSSRPGAVLVDVFCGSGSSVIAAEQLGRRFLGMELDPAYVDVSVDRWEGMTGEKATRA